VLRVLGVSGARMLGKLRHCIWPSREKQVIVHVASLAGALDSQSWCEWAGQVVLVVRVVRVAHPRTSAGLSFPVPLPLWEGFPLSAVSLCNAAGSLSPHFWRWTFC